MNSNIQTFIFTLITLVSFIQCTSTNQTNQSQEVPIQKVSYESHIKPIVRNYCLTCHAGKTPSARLDLSTYDNLKDATKNGELLKRINDHSNPMPKNGLMPKNERLLFLKWVKNSYKKTTDSLNSTTSQNSYNFTPPNITAINIDQPHAFDFFNKMQGHWVGKMNLMGENIPWFTFDYRATAPSHIHGMFEGGTIGNLFTAFFIANYKGTETIMVRNGGILNGIYRTSYFVLETIEQNGEETFYRFVDAYGGKQIMWIEVRFQNDKLELKVYTSRFGTYPKPTKHMVFNGRKQHLELAKTAAKIHNFPSKVIEKQFPKGLPTPQWEDGYTATSGSYIWQDETKDILELAKLAQDPYPINEIPYLSQMDINIEQTAITKNKKTTVYLSRSPLTDSAGRVSIEYGYIKQNKMDEVLLFSEIEGAKFKYTYLHPGDYYITAFVDVDNNSALSKGDITNRSFKINIKPKSTQTITIDNINIQN